MTRDHTDRLEGSGDDERLVRDLMASAGPRPGVPPEDLEEIRAAARSEWRRLAADGTSATPPLPDARFTASRVRRSLPLAAGVLLAVALAWWLTARTTPTTPAFAMITVSEGAVEIGGRPALVGEPVAADVPIEVADGAGIALRLPSGHSVRLKSGSAAELLATDRIELKRGAVYVDSGLESSHGDLTVVTRYGSVTEIGTQFEVRLPANEQALAVRVREGQIVLQADGIVCPDGSVGTCRAAPGEELRLSAGGRVELASAGTAWSWASELAPLPSDNALLNILRWGAREEGIDIEWSDPTLRDEASPHTYNGVRQSPRAVIENALRAAGLAYRWEAEKLIVTGPASS